MKRVFVEALQRTGELPEIRSWQTPDFRFLHSLPGFVGWAVRLLQTEPVQDRVFVLHEPFSQGELLALINWADQLNVLFDADDGGDEVYNCVLPDGDKAMILFAPFIQGHVNYGEVMFVARGLTPALYAEWCLFCDHFASLLLSRFLPASRFPATRTGVDPVATLEFVLDLHRLAQWRLTGQDWSPRHPEDQWFEEDAAYLYRLLANFQAQFDLDTVFVVQRVAPELNHIILLSWVSEVEALHPGVREMLEDLLSHDQAGTLADARIKVFQAGRLPPDYQQRTPSSQSFVCEVGEMRYGYLGVCMQREADLKPIYRLMALLANHLAFRFAHLYQLRKEEVFAQKLKNINMACDVLTIAENPRAIFDQLQEHLHRIFGQNDGLILLIPPGTQSPEIERKFGSVPDGVDLAALLGENGWVGEQILEGAALRDISGTHDSIRYIFPFSSTPQVLPESMEIVPQQSLGGLILFHSQRNRDLRDDDHELLQILLDRVKTSLQATFNYQEKLETIKALEGLIGTLMLQDEDQLLGEMIQIIRRLLKVNRVSFLALDDDGAHFRIRKSYGIPLDVVERTRIPLGSEITGTVAMTGRSLKIKNIEESEEFQKRSQERYFNGSLLSVPLKPISSGGTSQVKWVINVNNKINGLIFTDQDQKLLEAIANLIMVALANKELLGAKMEKDLMDRQMADAREVWSAMLPKSFKNLPEVFSLSAKSEPAREVGGDFYDVLHMTNGRWLLAMGDVSGKGMPAAILMATTRVMLRSAIRDSQEPAAILTHLDKLLAQELDGYHMVTLLLVSVDPGTGQADFASAGHGPVMACLGGQVQEIGPGRGQPLGLGIEPAYFSQNSFQLQSGDLLFLYTDGLTEERAPDREQYGTDRLMTYLRKHQKRQVLELVDGIFREVAQWRQHAEAHDDLTVMAMRYRRNA
ncbi:MAG TPA: SpoIIE family protein phosphatase [Candidatus Ozemobacteraceae bacterium]|nr:SpoIIE family protein phosphatase [Candidatus Ozemobacteraceae bacterium]